MSLRARQNIERLAPCAHGGLIYDELRSAGASPESISDFSVCTNPFMPPPGLDRVLAQTAVNEYPDSRSTEFRQRLGQKLGISPDLILAGGGTTELIRLVALAYLRSRDKVLVCEPTYGEYEIAGRIAGASPKKLWMGLHFDIERTVHCIREQQPRVIFLCNPNNPTGQYLPRKALERLVGAAADSLIVLDEAYVNFVATPWTSTDLISKGNLVILRSLTKDYGLAGLRLGYAIADSEIIGNLRRVCPPWNVSAFAQKAGLLALGSDDFLAQSLRDTRELKQYLADSLAALGHEIVPSDTHYLLVKVGNGTVFRQALLKKGLLVRDGASFELPEYVRLSPRTRPECARLIGEIEAMKPP